MKRGEKGVALIIAILLIFILGTQALIWSIETLSAMKAARVNRWQVQCASFSRATMPDLETAVQHYLNEISGGFQEALNEKYGVEGKAIDIEELNSFCKGHFPRYYPLEMRGASLDAKGIHDTEGMNGNWRGMRGRATMSLEYDGIRNGKELGLEENKELMGLVVQLTCTVPYDIEMYPEALPEDGEATGELGSLWRPMKGISTRWKEEMKEERERPSFQRARYSSAAEMKVYIALAKIKKEDTPITPSPGPRVPEPANSGGEFEPCVSRGIGADVACAGMDNSTYPPTCTRYVVSEDCKGQYSGFFKTEKGAQDVANAVNERNRDAIETNLKALRKNNEYTPIPVGYREGMARGVPYDGDFYPPLPEDTWGPIARPPKGSTNVPTNPRSPGGSSSGQLNGSGNPTTPVTPTMPTTPSNGNNVYGSPMPSIRATSNVRQVKIMFTRLVPMLPGRYEF